MNLIGEFTDLTGGLVLPVALDLGIRVECVASERTLLTSDAFQGTSDDADWGRYAAAVEAELADVGRAPIGIEGTVHSTLPVCPMCAGESWEQVPWSPFSRARRRQ